jgi:cholesterol transport system auxiliary component
VRARRAVGRRGLIAAGTALLGGCSVLPQPRYVQQTTWPLAVSPPEMPARSRRGRKILLVRDFQASPGLDQRGVQWLNPDGSVHVDFYNLWSVLPAQGVTDSARRWLLASGRFRAVVAPDSGVIPDLTLEAELTTLIADPRLLQGRAGLAITVLNQDAQPARVLEQRTLAGQARMPTDNPAGVVAAERGALADMLRGLLRTMLVFA